MIGRCKMLLCGWNRAWSKDESNKVDPVLVRATSTVVKRGWGKVKSTFAAAQRLKTLLAPMKVSPAKWHT